MIEWQTIDDPIPDPGNQWDQSTWIVYTVEDGDSPWMAVTTLMGFYNLVNFNEAGDPLPAHWMLINAPVLKGQKT